MRPGEGRTAAKKPGTLICGKWKVDRVIKVTDQLATYEARDPKGAKVHLKVIHPYKADDAPLVARLKREAYVANRIKHPSMVRVLGDGMTDEGSLAIALELVDGETLEELRMKRGGMLPPEEVIKYGSALCDALQAAHDEQIVHRDVRPESFMVTKQGELRVPEFAAARVLGETVEAKERTAAGATLGSPAFMSPEQARGQRDRVDARSDVFGLGATLYTLVSGKTVHAADNPLAGLLSASRDRAKPVRTVMRTAIPDHLADAIDKALKFEPTDRFPSMRAFKRALTPKEEARPAAAVARTEASPVRASQKPAPPLLGRPPTAQPFAPSPPAVAQAPAAPAAPMARPSGMMAAPTQASPAMMAQGHAQGAPMGRPSGMMGSPVAPTQASPAVSPMGYAGPTRPSPSMPPPPVAPAAAPEAPPRQKPQRPDIALVRQEVDEESTAVMDQPPPGMSASGSTPPPAPQGYGGHGHAQGYGGHGSMPPPAMGMGHPSPGMGGPGMGMGHPSGSVPPPAHPSYPPAMGMPQPAYGAPPAGMGMGYSGHGAGAPGHAQGYPGQLGPQAAQGMGPSGHPGAGPGAYAGQGMGGPGQGGPYAGQGMGGPGGGAPYAGQGMGGPGGGAPYAGQGMGGPGQGGPYAGQGMGGPGQGGPYAGQGMGGPGGSGPFAAQGMGGPGQGMGGPGASGPYPGQAYGAPGMGSGFPGPMPGGPGGPQGLSGPMGVMPGQAPASNRTFAYVAVGMGGTLIVLALVYAFFFMKPG